jgi:hypothetical protein
VDGDNRVVQRQRLACRIHRCGRCWKTGCESPCGWNTTRRRRRLAISTTARGRGRAA